jgi:hypothetical protein
MTARRAPPPNLPPPSSRPILQNALLAVLLATLLALAAFSAIAWNADPSILLIQVSFSSVGALLVSRRPRQPIGWLLLVLAVSFVPLGTSVAGTASDIVDGRADLRITLQAWLVDSGAAVFFAAFATLAAVFPSGRFPAGALGWIARLAVTVPVVFAVVLLFNPQLGVTFRDGTTGVVTNPVGFAPGWAGWEVLDAGAYVVVLAALVVGLGTFLARFRRARDVERAQGKWLLAALALVLASVIFAFAMIIFVDPVGEWVWSPAAVAYPLAPIAIGIAVLRYRLFDIDRLISRTLAYAIITAILAALFVGLVLGLQAVAAPLTSDSAIAVAVSTLAVAALFGPLRRRVQSLVDRRFDRARYDAALVADGFGARLRDRLDLDTVGEELAATVQAALRPESVSIWVRAPRS